MGKKDEMQVFVCQTCGTVSNAEVKSCFRCGKENILKMPESSLRAFEKEAARCFNGGRFYRTEDLRRIEPYYFKANQFVPGFLISLGDCDGRIFTINKEKTHYYCSPTYENQIFIIRKCDQIKSIEFVETSSLNLSRFINPSRYNIGYPGSLIAGASPSPSKTIQIRILTTDVKEPEVNLPILPELEIEGSQKYAYGHQAANEICRELKRITGKAGPQEDVDAGEGGGLIGQLKELAELKEQGLLTEEEFVLAKKKLLL